MKELDITSLTDSHQRLLDPATGKVRDGGPRPSAFRPSYVEHQLISDFMLQHLIIRKRYGARVPAPDNNIEGGWLKAAKQWDADGRPTWPKA